MADITVRLIWYKLGEVGEKMAEAGRTWYTELDFDSYVLDLLLLGWVSVCLVTMLAVNTVVSVLGPVQKQPDGRDRLTSDSSSRKGVPLPIETCQWFNNAVNWFYLHYYHTPDFVEEWLRTLNEQLTKLGGPVQAKIEKVLPGSLPPQVTHVSCEASPQDRFVIHAKLESWDLSFQVFTSQQTQEGVKLTKCTASILRLKGMLRIASFREGADVKVSVSFETKPEIKVMAKPQNPYQEASELVDLGVVEENIRNSLTLGKSTFIITHLLMPGDLQTVGHDQPHGRPGEGGGDSGPKKDVSGPQKRKPASQQSAPSSAKDPMQMPPAAPVADETIILPAAVPQQNTAPPAMSRPTFNEKRPANQDMMIQQQRQQQQQQQQLAQQQQQQRQQQQQQYQKRQDELLQEQQLQQHLQQQLQQQPVVRREQRVRPQSRPEGIFEPVEAMRLQSSLYSAPPKPPRMVGEKRLLVKVIKANGLALRELGSASTVCIVSTDEPVQGYGTSIVKNTCHPFWDEHFIFDITQETSEVRVEVYDKGRNQGDDFVGEAIVYVEDLRKTPSSRQILRLHPQPGNMEYNAGTVTAEFLFMDPAEADLLLDSMTQQTNAQLSPRRRIEVNRSMAPGGTLVTTTTTTTERPHYGRHEPGLDGSPNYIEKNIYPDESPRFSFNDTSSNVSSETIPANGVSTVAATALRELKGRSGRQRTPTKSSTIIITGVRRTIESTPPVMDDYRAYPGDSVPSGPTNDKDKKKGSFGSAILKRFGRKKRAQSADRTLSSSFREGSYLRPPEQNYGPQSKDDLELVRRKQQPPPSPNLKKSRTLGGSLKKLFRRGRKRSQGRGDHSRESSTSRGSHRGGSKNASRDNSLTRQSQREYEQRASSVS